MAPDADKLRQRKGGQQVVAEDHSASEEERIATTPHKIKASEVVIDGVIYDISNFEHPGGESIHVFGGNDVTATYKMIHPYHTSKHLEKMKRVGTIPNWKSE